MSRKKRFDVESPLLPCLPLYEVRGVEEQEALGRYEVSVHKERQEALLQALAEPDFPIGAEVRLVNVRMKLLRLAKGLERQEDLGELVGVSSNTISHFETLRAFPNKELAEKIARALETTVDFLFPGWLQFFVSEPVTIVRKFTEEEIKALCVDQSCLLPAVTYVKEEAEERILCQTVQEAISLLPKREGDMLKRWLGIGYARQTMAEIAEVYELTSGRVQQLIRKAFCRLENPRGPELKALMQSLQELWSDGS